jgi:enoyl-CoA hydratase
VTRLKFTRQAEIAMVTLDHPPMNVMDATLLEELAGLFEGLAAEETVRGAVIAAEGRAFSAGLDLKAIPGLDRLGRRRLIDALNDCFGTLYTWPKPLVAAVSGHAIAGGLVLALCADRRIAANVALQASLAEVKVGVTYPVAALEVARAELTPAAARRLILLGETLDVEQAVSLGVFDACVPLDQLLQKAIEQVRRDAVLPPKAFATIKRELRGPQLARIAAARHGKAEPRLAWRRSAPRRGRRRAWRAVTGCSFASSGRRAIVPGGRTFHARLCRSRRSAHDAARHCRRAGAEQGAERALARSTGEVHLAELERRQCDRQLHGVSCQTFQAVSRPVPAGSTEADLQAVRRRQHRHRRDRGDEAELRSGTAVDDHGKLVVNGYFPTEPLRVIFALEFIPSDGEWKLISINVKTDKPS